MLVIYLASLGDSRVLALGPVNNLVTIGVLICLMFVLVRHVAFTVNVMWIRSLPLSHCVSSVVITTKIKTE